MNIILDIKYIIQFSKHWWITGKKFGYPLCCRLFFLTPVSLTDTYRHNHAQDGYVPCPICELKSGRL